MHSILKTLLVLSIPMLIKYVFLLFSIQFELVSFEDVIEDIAFFAIIFFLVYFPLLKIRFYLKAIIIIFLIYVVLETTSYMAVSSNFTSSYMYLLIESNKAELTEFTNSYINIKIVLFFISVLVSYFILIKNIKPSKKYHLVVPLVSASVIIIVLKVTGFIESNAYHNIVRGTYGYYDLQNNTRLNTNISKNDIKSSSNNEVLVVVLGESTARGHMQIYGYNRETTPKLNSISQSLYVYKNVISTEVFTLKAMPKIITSMSNNNNNNNNKGLIDLVQLFNVAGYDTYWLSNQRPISYHDNFISRIASQANEFKFYNHLIDKHSQVLDEVVFPDYERILKKEGKKVIFIRLIGTHFNYSNRYPINYNKFVQKEKPQLKHFKINNEYDNAILYNDFIIFTLIKKLEGINSKSALIYTSDHGENVYDNGTDFFGRSEEILTPSMFEIPFIFWASKSFHFPDDFIYNPARRFIADNTYESIGHIFGVKHKNMDFTSSIFSDSYKERTRLVLDGIDFDKEVLQKNE